MSAKTSLGAGRSSLAARGLVLVAAVVAFVVGWGALSPAVPTAQAFQDTPAAPAAAPAADGLPPQKSFLKWTIDASGPFGAIIGLLSFLMVAMIMMNALQLRRDNIIPSEFIEHFEQKLNAKDYQGAYELAKTDESLVARMLTVGLGRLNRGYSEAIEGMQEVGEDENMTMEHRLSYLGMIGTIAPMLGLMGTVQGMIMSFRVIANSTTTPKPYELAEGISTALVTTIEGLIVAIPAMIAFGIFKNRVARFMLELGIIAEGLMSRFAALGKKTASAPGGAAPAAAPAASSE